MDRRARSIRLLPPRDDLSGAKPPVSLEQDHGRGLAGGVLGLLLISAGLWLVIGAVVWLAWQ